MTELVGEPVTTVARINVIWLDTLRGLGVIIILAAVVFVRPPLTLQFTLLGTCVFEVLAWMALRGLGGALRLGFSGGIAAVSGPTLYIAGANWFTSQPTKILGRWPRENVVLRRVKRLGLRRLLSVTVPGTDATAYPEILGRRKDDTIADLFGPVRNESSVS